MTEGDIFTELVEALTGLRSDIAELNKRLDAQTIALKKAIVAANGADALERLEADLGHVRADLIRLKPEYVLEAARNGVVTSGIMDAVREARAAAQASSEAAKRRWKLPIVLLIVGVLIGAGGGLVVAKLTTSSPPAPSYLPTRK